MVVNDDEEEDVEQDGWGWAGIIFELANDDITKIDLVCERPILEALNWLMYNKQKRDRINMMNKNAKH